MICQAKNAEIGRFLVSFNTTRKRKAEPSSKPSTKRAKQSKLSNIQLNIFFMKCVNIKFEIEIHNLTNLNTLPPI